MPSKQLSRKNAHRILKEYSVKYVWKPPYKEYIVGAMLSLSPPVLRVFLKKPLDKGIKLPKKYMGVTCEYYVAEYNVVKSKRS